MAQQQTDTEATGQRSDPKYASGENPANGDVYISALTIVGNVSQVILRRSDPSRLTWSIRVMLGALVVFASGLALLGLSFLYDLQHFEAVTRA